MPPTISVLIPAHNAETTVQAAVASILRQTRTDYEIVAIDDGSTDATGEMLDAFAAADPRVRVIHTPQRGIIHALNVAVAVSEGKILARMDADDICHPRRLELQGAYMEGNPQVSVCSTCIKMFPRSALLGGMVRYEEWLNRTLSHQQITTEMFIESPLAHPSVMLRRDELINIGGYQDRGWAEDYDLWLRYHAAGKLFAKLTGTLVFWRQSQGRLTFTDSRYSVENFLRAKAHYLSAHLAATERPILLWGAGKTGRRLSKHLIREGLQFEGFIDIHSDKIGHTLRRKPIHPPEYLDAHPECYVISAVSSLGSRALIREYLRGLGRTEVTDFICAA